MLQNVIAFLIVFPPPFVKKNTGMKQVDPL